MQFSLIFSVSARAYIRVYHIDGSINLECANVSSRIFWLGRRMSLEKLLFTQEISIPLQDKERLLMAILPVRVIRRNVC